MFMGGERERERERETPKKRFSPFSATDKISRVEGELCCSVSELAMSREKPNFESVS
jgi:hypothetical protein